MFKLISNLILYNDIGDDSILASLGNIYRAHEEGTYSRPELVRQIYVQVKRLLDVSTEFGFNTNLWHNYLTFKIISNINSFSLTCERRGASEGSVNSFALNDFRAFKALFDFDFHPLEEELGITCFDILENYNAISKASSLYDVHVSEVVQALSKKLENAADEKEFFDLISEHYKVYGVGMFGLNRAFRVKGHADELQFVPVSNPDPILLDDLIGYERQKRQLKDNTEAFCKGYKANNCLLYGAAGTGKSSSIKAIINEYYGDGLRMIEVYKSQFSELANIIARIKKRNYRFIIYIDDLSFEENEVEYKFLKAIIEGGVENRPDNILIYATSNRRHLVKETWKDRADMEYDKDMHFSETMNEKLSLASRFGISINYPGPVRQEYNDIVLALARREGIDMSDDEILALANKWELRSGGISGRAARQFTDYLRSRQEQDSQNH